MELCVCVIREQKDAPSHTQLMWGGSQHEIIFYMPPELFSGLQGSEDSDSEEDD